MPYDIQDVIGLKAIAPILTGQELRWTQFGSP
jgi:hypothetical protein